MVKVKELLDFMEKEVPTSLAEGFDNVGLMIGDEEKEIKNILLALDCTKSVIEEAKMKNIDLILTHHPLMFIKPRRIVKSDLQGSKIIDLIKNDIAVYSAHTNLDSVNDGLNKTIMDMLGFNNSEILEKSKVDSSAGIGRIYTGNKVYELEELVKNLKASLGCENLKVAKGNREIKSIAVINGSGQSFFYKALASGADCIITGDTSYHFVSDFKEMGITVIDPGHFLSEKNVYTKVMKEKLSKLDGIKIFISESESDPYEFM